MANNNLNKAYQEALKQLDNLVKKQEALKKSTDNLANSWNAISTELFKMDGAQFFTMVEKSPEQLRAMGEEVANLEESFRNLGNDFAKTLGDDAKFKSVQRQLRGIGLAFEDSTKKTNALINSSFSEIYAGLDKDLQKIIKSESDLEKILKNKDKLTTSQKKKLEEFEHFQTLEKKHQELSEKYQKDMLAKMEAFKKIMPELATANQEVLSKLMSQIAAGKSIEELLQGAGDEERKILAALSSSNDELKKMNKGMNIAVEQAARVRKEATEMNKQFSISKGLTEAIKTSAAGLGNIIRKDFVNSMMKFDEVLNQVQKDTSINMDLNKTAFAELQTEVAQFGMGIEDAGKMMATMSKELRTTNFGVLAQATKDFAAIEGATGAASEDIANIAGELMRMGEGSAQVKDYMQDADQAARKFGVSSSKVLGGISRNIKKIREMGFVGGEKSLAKMAATAERLRMNMDETFDMAKRARSIEGAMDMAAELQLAGGSFANINPMDLLAAARKGPAELQKILTTMGKDIGHFSKETGKFEFDPVDVDRLQMVSEATGQSMESLQNMIQKNAEDTEKLHPFQGIIDGLDEAQKDIAKSSLSDMMKFDAKTGKMEIDVDNDMAKKMGITDLAQITPEIMQDILKQKDLEAQTLEEQNKRNQSLKKSFDNFINALMSVFSFFQPAIEFLTEVLQGVNKVFTTIMGWLPGWSKALLGGLILFGTTFGSSVMTFVTKGVGSFVKGVGSFAKSAISGVGKAAGIGGLTEKAGAVTKAGAPAEAAGGAKGGLMSIAEGLKSFGTDAGKILKGAAVLSASAGMLIITFTGLGLAFQAMGGDFNNLLKFGAALVELSFAMFIMSKAANGINIGGVLKLSIAAAIMGAAMIPMAFAMQMLQGVEWTDVLIAIGIMTGALLALGLLGYLMTPLLPGLAIMVLAFMGIAVGLAALGGALLLSAMAFEKLGAIDWGVFSTMGDALLSSVPGLLGFSMAALLFANPLSILGIMFMSMALAGLATVMVPLATSLEIGANSLDRFASGLDKLGEAADRLSLEKLEKLKELSDAMANASAGGAAMAAMAGAANAMGGGGGAGGDGEVRKIEVDVKMNGRDLQNFIVKDTAILR